MADYNIYIHSDQAEESHPTKANDNEKSETKSFGDGFSKTLGAIQNPDSLLSGAISYVAKSVPAIAGAFAVYKLGEQTIQTVESFRSLASGDYSYQTYFTNKHAEINAIIKPFSTIVNAERTALQIRVQNDRLNQYRQLTGDAIINSYGKGV